MRPTLWEWLKGWVQGDPDYYFLGRHAAQARAEQMRMEIPPPLPDVMARISRPSGRRRA